MSVQAGPDEGVVCTPHPLATEAGLAVLREGGTAAAAAVAAGAVLAVVCPHFCGLGGDAVWMLSDSEGLRTCVLGIGQAAEVIDTSGPIPTRGPGSMLTTAGLVPSWERLLEISRSRWNGRLPLDRLLEPAIAYAEAGFEVGASHAFWLDYRKEEIKDWPGFADAFQPWRKTPDVGALFRQPDLADLLRMLVCEELDSFHSGAVALRIAEGLAAAGSPISEDDLARTHAVEVTPLSLRSGAWTLFAPPPPTQGATTLAIRGILDRIAGVPSDRTCALHRQVEAVKQAFLCRGTIADPEFSDQSGALPSNAALQRLASAIAADHAMPWPRELQTADTAFLAVTDAQGRSVCGLQSTYFDWGSGVPVGDTGILWHNRGAAFDTMPGSPNCLAPGKRPFHTLNPGMAFTDDGAAIFYGTQGADGQPQTLTVLLDRLMCDGASAAEALSTPRYLLGRTFSDKNDTLKIETSVGEEVVADLEYLGHEVAPLPELSPLAGLAGVIRIDPAGHKDAAHDPRGDGTAGKA